MAAITYEDFSGSNGSPTENPYDALLIACNNDVSELHNRYIAHRTARNLQQAALILDRSFEGWKLDPILVKLDGPQRDPTFVDPRNCLVLWARPPRAVRELISNIQRRLLKAAPKLWIMPPDRLHMTAMEVAFSKTAEEIAELVKTLAPSAEKLTDYPFYHRARLIKPMIGFDAAALALSFVPADGENLPPGRTPKDDSYTYHHLRRDLHALCQEGGVEVGSRYVVPSAHLTIARFNTPNVFECGDDLDASVSKEQQLREKWIQQIKRINEWLEKEYWPSPGQTIQSGGEWIVGEEVGLDFHKGKLWYGGGEEVRKGKGFAR